VTPNANRRPKTSVATARGLRERVDDLINTLRANDWPLGAKARPLTSLGEGEWTELTADEAAKDPERARRNQACKEGEQDCHRWRGHLRAFMEDSRRYVVDYGRPDQVKRFMNNKLVIVSSVIEDLPREMYKTDECLLDLESLKALVVNIRFIRVRSKKTAAFSKNLRLARTAYGQTQEQGAAAIGLTQSVYALYEAGRRMPQVANRTECDRYIEQAPRSASPN
jgi:DNA-binding XRE family transcriptional regulator